MTPEQKARLRALLLEALSLLGSEEPAAPAPQPPTPTPARRHLAWGAKVSGTFRERVLWIAETLAFDPDWLMSAMAFETGERFTADVKNPASSATGLIQFMAQTALDLGTTVAKLAAMSVEDQLNYVYKYFQPYRGRIHSLADLYMVILWPKAVGEPLDYPLFVAGKSSYAVNAGLDANKDRVVTKAEAAARVAEKLAKGLRPENVA